MTAHIYGSKYNPVDAQIKTWSVQRTLDPLLAEVCDILHIASIKKKGIN